MAQVNRLVRVILFLPLVPGAHQRVLQNRQLVRVVAYVVEQPVDQTRGDFGSADGYGAGDGSAALFARHSRDQVLAFVDGFGQVLELSAIAQVIRTHRQRDVNVQLALGGGFQQQFDEGRFVVGFFFVRLIALRAMPDSERLLELIGSLCVCRSASPASELTSKSHWKRYSSIGVTVS